MTTPWDYELQGEVLRLRKQNEALFRIVQMYRVKVASLQTVIDTASAEYDTFLSEIRSKESPD